MSDKKEFIWPERIDKLDDCIALLEATANNFYIPEGKELWGWNTLLGARDKIKALKEKEMAQFFTQFSNQQKKGK